MCGIAGIISSQAQGYQSRSELMLKALAHRGPDEQASFCFSNCLLAQARLSVVDIAGGSQPMLSPDKALALVLNGEIYGYQAIKQGDYSDYNFQTNSDTELVLAMYQAKGESMLVDLPGAFAFALWDESKQSLFAARDRFGEKPFYYTVTPNNELIFASELKAILASGLLKPELDLDSLAHYLKYLCVPADKSIYKNISVLAPGHSLLWQGGNLNIQSFWQLPAKINIAADEAVRELDRLTRQAVAKQLVADVEVGAFLSGGLDSSTIVALASEHKKIKTFSFGFSDGPNELAHARTVANLYHTDHYELSDQVDIAELLLTMGDIYDEPFADSSNIPTYLLGKFAKEQVKVVLSGDGADELLGGYAHYQLMSSQSSLPSSCINPLLFSAKVLRRLGLGDNFLNKARAWEYKSLAPTERHAHYNHSRQYFDQADIASLLPKKILQPEKYSEIYDASDLMRIDVLDLLPSDMLVKVDRATMASGLELRSPFLDRDLAEFALSLPAHLKVDEQINKKLLRQTFAAYLPNSIKNRPKQGFGGPVSAWLKSSSVGKLKAEYLLDQNKKIYSIIDYQGALRYYYQDNYQTWILLVLSIWCEKWLKNYD